MFSGMKNKEHESMHGPRTFHLDGGGGQRDPGNVSLYRILQRAVLNSFDISQIASRGDPYQYLFLILYQNILIFTFLNSAYYVPIYYISRLRQKYLKHLSAQLNQIQYIPLYLSTV